VTLEWRDPRQAFDPAAEGVGEKIYQGSYQFNEISPSWYPQLVPVNATGTYETNGVLLRVRADGTSTLIETLVMSAKAELDMRRFPFDKQRLVAIFEILGFSRDEVSLLVAAGAESVAVGDVRIPQWQVTGARLTTTDEPPSHLERSGMSSALILSIDVERKSWFARRLVVIPLIAIVLLSFSVFWMDRSSLGDRLSVSFIGILTAVTYQLVTSEQLPHISYVTLMHGFLSFSFLTMCATVVINLVVGSMDKRGEVARGDQIDRRCRWIFPLVYFGFILLILGVEYLEF